MRLSHSLASLTVAVALVLSLPYEALPHARVKDNRPPAPSLFGSECRTSVRGSHVVAYCHNPYVDTDRVSLHIECARWWDLDTDGDPVDTGPAMTVRLSGRCWKEVGSVWISHQKAD
ncbi:hypothetical protein [Streptomyces sp. HUAS TT20]|uniref:hypothetical protein n=1 Tax=Streptomyces sp. HUAS TT20 TaxID=3447509 RepID=UPI0021DB2C7E|nr:hypothetical protein [Streptomyces sp. HUAS 15-9]UXY26730.1 hypothetical protein N8I87_09150 [Streptomyces sp. HUAS 15-9]